jgi:hypothetical protein
MSTIEFTDLPGTLLSEKANLIWWNMQITAHSLFPDENATVQRRKWVDKIVRDHGIEWTSRICPLRSAGRSYERWMALHGYSRTQDEIADFNPTHFRDLLIAADVLQRCTLTSCSKAQAFQAIANDLRARGASSSESAQSTIKRAWRKYNPGCHFMAAEHVMWQTHPDYRRIDPDRYIIESVSLAEKLRLIGETTVPLHGSVPILDPAKTWKVPALFPVVPIDIVECDGEVFFQCAA